MHLPVLNAGVVGLGVGTQHALTLLSHPSCKLRRVVDFDQNRLDDFARLHPTAEIEYSTSFQSIVDDPSIGLVSLASFDDHHFEQVMAAFDKGKHVFVEKPLCQTKEQLRAIVASFRKNQLGLSSNLLLRTADLYIHVKKLIDDERLGEIYAIDGDYLYGRLHKITEGWRKEVDPYSVMAGGGIHLIDLMMWLTNQRPNRVFSRVNKIASKNTGFRFHDFHSSEFEFSSGMIGRITANFGCVHRHQHVVRIFGTKGTFIHDDAGARIHWSREESVKPETLALAPKPATKGKLIEKFIEAISEKKLDEIAQREFDLMSVVLAADEAVLVDKPLNVEYF